MYICLKIKVTLTKDKRSMHCFKSISDRKNTPTKKQAIFICILDRQLKKHTQEKTQKCIKNLAPKSLSIIQST